MGIAALASSSINRMSRQFFSLSFPSAYTLFPVGLAFWSEPGSLLSEVLICQRPPS